MKVSWAGGRQAAAPGHGGSAGRVPDFGSEGDCGPESDLDVGSGRLGSSALDRESDPVLCRPTEPSSSLTRCQKWSSDPCLGAAFGRYLAQFSSAYVTTYAGLASAMIALVFLYWTAGIFVYGGEFNQAIRRARAKKKQPATSP